MPVTMRRGLEKVSPNNVPLDSAWASQERFHSVMKANSKVGIVMLNLEGNTVFWNAGAEQIFDRTETAMMGQTVDCLFTVDDLARGVSGKELGAAMQNGYCEDERWHLKGDGSRIWLTGITAVVRDQEKQAIGFSKVFFENTIRKQTEDEIKAANSRLAQFAYLASHDLKEPLRMVNSFLKLLKENLADTLDRNAEEFLHFAMDGGIRMRELVDRLVDYCKIGVDKKMLRVCDASAIADSAISFMSPLIKKSNATVTRSPLPLIKAFPTLLEQVFQNLISNSVKYQRRGTAPHIFIDAFDRDGEWLFSVSDNGLGVAERSAENFR